MRTVDTTRVPKYTLHRASGQAVVRLNGQDVYLGKHGTKQSKAEYSRVIAEWLAAGRQLPGNPKEVAIVEIIASYIEFAKGYYRRADGTPTSEIERIKRELSQLKTLYGRTVAAEFSPLKLKALRDSLIGLGWVRSSINHAVGTIRRMFRWATENEMIPGHVHQGLSAVAGLRAGRSEAAESDPVKPVPIEYVYAILPFVMPPVAAMIQLQLCTGMRSGEVRLMRTAQIDTTGKLWAYKPATHKTAHHGHERVIYLGPRAQELVRPFLKPDLQEFIFSPAEGDEHRIQEQAKRRRTPKSCGTRATGKRRKYHDHYTNESYRRAIVRGCNKADGRAKGGLIIGNDERIIPDWHPHQLRHTAATALRKTHGIEAAQVILGHRTLSVTEIYAEKNIAAAMKIMAEVG